MTPAGTSNELDVQNGWEENTHTLTVDLFSPSQLLSVHVCKGLEFRVGYEAFYGNVCVCVFSSHSFWTSMDVPAGVTQEEGHTGFLIHLLSAVRALIFLARRNQPFLSLIDREVMANNI